jgi:hypothetical protein
MNERIQQLEKQSYTEVMHEMGGTYMAFDKEKFALLIVRECMDITKQCSTGNGIHDLFADEIIAQHFGVE